MKTIAKGIDVSKWQGSINWTQVKGAGISFVMMRLGRGKWNGQPCDYDIRFKDNIAGALAAGLGVGVYFYSYALSVADAKAEAEWVIKALEPYKGKLTYPVAFDLEDSSQAGLGKAVLSDMIVAFCGALEAAGYYVSLYSNLSWLTAKYDAAKIKQFDVWLAQWEVSAPTYSGSFGMWQHTSKGSVPGISGNVDLDVAYYDFPGIIRGKGLNGFGAASTPEPSPSPVPGPGKELTGQGLADYCKGLLGQKSVYLYGGFGQQLTAAIIDAKAKQYPKQNTAARAAYMKTLVGKGYIGSDCVGMIKSYYWGGVGNLKYNAATDKSAGGMLAAATVKGEIGSLPERPGVCVWMEGHIGVYVGNGEVVECTLNSKFGDGIVKTKLSDRKWLKWLECPYISYEAAPAPVEPPKEQEPTPVPDWKQQGLTALTEAGVITDPDYWAGRITDTITVGEVMGIAAKMFGMLK